jgi:MarR family transcriptional regulator, 2-MHQ and catechol-resistance regulon repressor
MATSDQLSFFADLPTDLVPQPDRPIASTDPPSESPQQFWAESFVFDIWRLAQSWDSQFAAFLKAVALTPTQFLLLRLLYDADEQGLPCHEINARMLPNDSDVTRLLHRLAQRALVERHTPTPDRRRVYARLTPSGQELYLSLAESGRQFYERQLRPLSRKDVTKLHAQLTKLLLDTESQSQNSKP